MKFNKSYRFALCVCSSILYILSFPMAFGTHPWWNQSYTHVFTLISFLPMLFLSSRSTPRQSWMWGFVFHAISGLGTLYWIFISMRQYGDLNVFLATMALILIIVVRALVLSIPFYWIGNYRGPYPRVWTAAALTMAEYVFSFFPVGGFPWIVPSYGLYSDLPLIQIIDVIGTLGLTFLFFLFSTHVVFAMEMWIQGKAKTLTKTVGMLVGSMIVIHLYGFYQIHRWQSETSKNVLEVAYLQPNISQDVRLSKGAGPIMYQRYFDLLSNFDSSHVDLIVWPEAALPQTVSDQVKAFPFLNQYAPDAFHVIGAVSWQNMHSQNSYFNSAFLVDDQGTILSRYDKRHLVPFGEYVPLVPILQRWIPAIAGDFEAADQLTFFSVNDHRFSTLICYEVLFPELARQAAKQGSEFFVNITNDAWFNNSSGPYQHLRFGAFRAIETRKEIVRSANTGVSASYTVIGEIQNQTPFFEQGTKTATLHPNTYKTFYVRFPHLALMIILGLFFWPALSYFVQRYARQS
ncbi:MAG: apolipoprotein N-acyltransferase [Bdellovibrionota bacterium]